MHNILILISFKIKCDKQNKTLKNNKLLFLKKSN